MLRPITKSDSGSADSDQIPIFPGFVIDSNLFFKIQIWDSSIIRMILKKIYEVLLKNGIIWEDNFGSAKMQGFVDRFA